MILVTGEVYRRTYSNGSSEVVEIGNTGLLSGMLCVDTVDVATRGSSGYNTVIQDSTRIEWELFE